MRITRIEEITVEPDKGETFLEVEEIMQSLPNIKVIEVLEEEPAYVFKIERFLELYPDTIK